MCILNYYGIHKGHLVFKSFHDIYATKKSQSTVIYLSILFFMKMILTISTKNNAVGESYLDKLVHHRSFSEQISTLVINSILYYTSILTSILDVEQKTG